MAGSGPAPKTEDHSEPPAGAVAIGVKFRCRVPTFGGSVCPLPSGKSRPTVTASELARRLRLPVRAHRCAQQDVAEYDLSLYARSISYLGPREQTFGLIPPHGLPAGGASAGARMCRFHTGRRGSRCSA